MHPPAKVWAERIAAAEFEADKLVRLYTRGGLTDADYDRHHEEIKSRKAAAERELAKASEASSGVEEMLRAKRAVLETWGTGLSLGLWWMPSRLRRQVYGLLGLRVSLSAEQELLLTGKFDADTMRLTPEVEEYVAGLREVDERLLEEARRDPPADHSEDLDRLEQEFAALSRRLRAGDATSG